jgi:hypothetical protein
MTRAALVARLAEQYNLDDGEPLLLADGFESACLGISRSFNTHKVCYDYARCLQILVERDKMTPEEAAEFFEFNVVGAYVGEGTPAFLITLAKDRKKAVPEVVQVVRPRLLGFITAEHGLYPYTLLARRYGVPATRHRLSVAPAPESPKVV